MSKLNQLKEILCRKVKINVMDNKPNPMSLDINLGEISREMGCSAASVKDLLKELQLKKEIKRLIPLEFNKDNYTLTVLENSSIMNS